MVLGKQDHAPCKICLLHKAFFVLVEFIGDHKTSYKDEIKSGHPQFLGYYRISICGLSACLGDIISYLIDYWLTHRCRNFHLIMCIYMQLINLYISFLLF